VATNAERIRELAEQTSSGLLRWCRHPDGTIRTCVDDRHLVLHRSDRGRVRLTIDSGVSGATLESSDVNLTGDLVQLWGLADAMADVSTPPRRRRHRGPHRSAACRRP
jgi:hypothetical protein